MKAGYAAGLIAAVAVLSVGNGAAAVGVLPLPDVLLSIDTQSSRTAISRSIYGVGLTDDNMNKGKPAYQKATSNRFGGDTNTALNWTQNISNAGINYRNVNGPFFFLTRLSEVTRPGDFARLFIEESQSRNAVSIITVPIISYVARDNSNDVSLLQTADAETFPHWKYNRARNPTRIADVNSPSIAGNEVYEDEFVRFVEARFAATKGDPKRAIFYSLDNEPDLWNDTHPLLHPEKPRYDEVLRLNLEYAAAIRDEAPAALIFGPVVSGFDGFLSLRSAPDASANGEFLDYYLDGMRTAELTGGKRLLNVLDLHFYSEATSVDGTPIGLDNPDPTTTNPSEALIQARVQAPRSLSEPDYVENSWTTRNLLNNRPINLIPWVRNKIANHYPDTKLAFTEYSYGGTTHISGAIAQADALGIFAREGVYAANYYELVSPGEYVYAAFDAYLNFDGVGGNVGDTSISAQTSDKERTAVHASVSNDDGSKVYVIAINKSSTDVASTIAINHPLILTQGDVYQLTSRAAKLFAAEPVTVSSNTLSYTMPAYSVSTIVLSGARSP